MIVEKAGESMSLEEEQVPALPKALQWAAVWLLILYALFVVNALAALVGLHVFGWVGWKNGRCQSGGL